VFKQVWPNIYRIEIPLPRNPLRFTNSYYIRGIQRSLLVDNGFNCDESRAVMDEAICALGIDLAKTDLFITHLHADHSGMTEYLASPTSRVFMSYEDGMAVLASQNINYWDRFNDFMKLSGLIKVGIENNTERHPGRMYGTAHFKNLVPVGEMDRIVVGDYSFQCIMTPGHTDGHVCLYEPSHHLLLSGDTILGKITPNISLWEIGKTDVLGQYLQSLAKIGRLAVDVVLPGHRHIIYDCRERIQQLEVHHQKRLDEVLGLLGSGSANATDIAKKMNWDLSIKEWEGFPWAQKLFSTGEALAHLNNLYQRGQILATKGNDGIYYFTRI
jgi:glyoxylase-like metal-dependent hydrolase (beta-lactamase superfamily II)